MFSLAESYSVRRGHKSNMITRLSDASGGVVDDGAEKNRIDAMTMQRFLPIGAAIVLGALGSPTSAIECARAVRTVEKTICADGSLRKADDQFNRRYAKLLDLLDRRQREELIESQRR